MATIKDWSTTASNNTQANTDIDWDENMLPSQVNNSARDTMAQIAQFVKDVYAGNTQYHLAGGVADAYTITPVPAVTAYAAGQTFAFKTTLANTGASTLDVNAVGPKTILRYDGTALAGGDIPAGGIVVVIYDGTNFRAVSPLGTAVLDADNIFSGANTFSGANSLTGNNSFTGDNTFTGANVLTGSTTTYQENSGSASENATSVTLKTLEFSKSSVVEAVAATNDLYYVIFRWTGASGQLVFKIPVSGFNSLRVKAGFRNAVDVFSRTWEMATSPDNVIYTARASITHAAGANTGEAIVDVGALSALYVRFKITSGFDVNTSSNFCGLYLFEIQPTLDFSGLAPVTS